MTNFFIINDYDKPSEDMVVQQVDNSNCEYLCERLRELDSMALRKESTNMKEFGFNVKEDEPKGYVAFEKENKSTALYSDGEPRDWQGSHSFSLKMK